MLLPRPQLLLPRTFQHPLSETHTLTAPHPTGRLCTSSSQAKIQCKAFDFPPPGLPPSPNGTNSEPQLPHLKQGHQHGPSLLCLRARGQKVGVPPPLNRGGSEGGCSGEGGEQPASFLGLAQGPLHPTQLRKPLILGWDPSRNSAVARLLQCCAGVEHQGGGRGLGHLSPSPASQHLDLRAAAVPQGPSQCSETGEPRCMRCRGVGRGGGRGGSVAL